MSTSRKDFQKERGQRQENRLLALLEDGPMDAFQLSAKLHLSKFQTHTYLNRLMAEPNKRVFISGFTSEHSQPRMLYELGCKKNVNVVIVQKQRLIDGLRDLNEPTAVVDLAKRVKMNTLSARRYVSQLRKAKRIYIAAWGWSGTSALPLYMAGRSEDASKITKRPEAPVKKQYSAPSPFAALFG